MATNTRPDYEIIQDVINAMLPYGSISEKLDNYVDVNVIINEINGSEETELISKAKIDIGSILHSELDGLSVSNVHPISSIGTSGGDQLSTILSEKAVISTIIATINASVEVTKISGSQIDLGVITHNSLDDRDVADCHPISAITDLTSSLSTLTSNVGTNTGNISTLTSSLSTLQGEVSAARHGYTDLEDTLQCIKLSLDELFSVTSGWSKPACYSTWTT